MEPLCNAYPLGDEELDRLEELLGGEMFHGEAVRLDELQGMLCAVVSSPEPVMPGVWIPAALGDAPECGSEARMREVIDLLMRLYDEVADGLLRGEEPLLILYPIDDDSDEMDYSAWADGYLFGTRLGRMDWWEAAADYADDLSELLDDFFLLNGSLKEDAIKHGESWMSADAENHALRLAAEDLPERVLAIYDFWAVLRSSVGTLRRELPKVGRNESCPCGSGRKYKRCCGDTKKLH